ncbi:hypothetical protein H7X87_02715 [Acetobacteraceae bacterium]|nr:hypothetical protein [Candidatus Parcubacteria bacterium]
MSQQGTFRPTSTSLDPEVTYTLGASPGGGPLFYPLGGNMSSYIARPRSGQKLRFERVPAKINCGIGKGERSGLESEFVATLVPPRGNRPTQLQLEDHSLIPLAALIPARGASDETRILVSLQEG